MEHIYKCPKGHYTMKETCHCGSTAISTKPGRYSPGKYADYRQKARIEELKAKGLL